MSELSGPVCGGDGVFITKADLQELWYGTFGMSRLSVPEFHALFERVYGRPFPLGSELRNDPRSPKHEWATDFRRTLAKGSVK